MKKSKVYIRYAVVAGSGNFPYDMLRFDSCFPERQEDTGRMDRYETQVRAVVVRRVSEGKPEFTQGRWRSFGWTVIGAGEDVSALYDLCREINELAKTDPKAASKRVESLYCVVGG